MKRTVAAALLLVVQLALVLSIAGKYLYERKTRPRVWVRTAQIDPNMPLRGRYLALRLAVNACGLPHDPAHFTQGYKDFSTGKIGPGSYRWSVSLGVQDGHLIPRLEDHARSPEGILDMTQPGDHSCESVPLTGEIELFIPDTAKPPFPHKDGQELWVEVTLPTSRPPRPIQLALSDSGGFRPLSFE